MTAQGLDLALRVAAILATLVASVVALTIAVQGRRAAARQTRLTFELTSAQRLVSILANYRGPLVPREVEGRSELPALAAALGERRVPLLWRGMFDDPPPTRTEAVVRRVIVSTDDMFAAERQWLREATMVLQDLAAELRSSEGNRRK